MKARARLVIFALAAIGAPALAAEAKPGATAAPGAIKHGVAHESVFALVGGTAISTAEYDALWTTVQRQKFYHRKAPEAEVAQVRREVGDARYAAGRYDEALRLFERLSLAPTFEEFLTLPAYAMLAD